MRRAKRTKRTKKTKSLRTMVMKRLMLIVIVPITLIFLIIFMNIYQSLRYEKKEQSMIYVEMLTRQLGETIEKYKSVILNVAADDKVSTMDYTILDDYLAEAVELNGSDTWSHIIICNKYGTEQSHSGGKEGHGYSISSDKCFQVPMKEQRIYVGQPTVSVSTGRIVMGIGVPIMRENECIGVMIGYVLMDHITELLNSNPITENSYTFMLNEDGTLSGHPETDRLLKENWNEGQLSQGMNTVVSEMLAGNSDMRIVEEGGQYNLVSYHMVSDIGLYIGNITPLSESYRIIFTTLFVMAVALIIFLCIGVFTSIYFAKNISKPVMWVEEQLQAMENGEMAKAPERLAFAKSKELLHLTKAVTEISTRLSRMLRTLEKESTVVNGVVVNVTEQIEDASGQMEQVITSMESLTSGVRITSEVLEQMKTHSEANLNLVTSIALYSADGKVYADEIQEQAEDAKEKMEKKVIQDVEDVQILRDKVNLSREMENQLHIVNSLTEEILKIASQTKLLSLKASIEASRAGASGSGFGVVAQEIGQLAASSRQTAEHIAETNKQIVDAVAGINQNSQEMMEFVEKLIHDDHVFFEKILDDYLSSGTQTNEMMERFNQHAQELQQNINQMDGGLADIVSRMEENQVKFEEVMSRVVRISDNTKKISDNMGVASESSSRLKDQG